MSLSSQFVNSKALACSRFNVVFDIFPVAMLCNQFQFGDRTSVARSIANSAGKINVVIQINLYAGGAARSAHFAPSLSQAAVFSACRSTKNIADRGK
jgi:hypothetical protein